MRAAVVTAFDQAPRAQEVPEPVPGDQEEVVDVLAVGLHPRVRSQASGSHYTSTGVLPLVPGVDGVGRRADGSLVYFVLPVTTTHGSMVERVAIDPRGSVVLPDDAAPVRVAAAMNPALSSWVALRRRAVLGPGRGVMILGATGTAGRLAIQVARALGAGTVTAVGRDPRTLALLPDLGADVVVPLGGDPEAVALAVGQAAADVDVVLDYLWGAPTQGLIGPVVAHRTDPARRLDWVEIGSVAGPDLTLPSAALRAVDLRLLGSGQGSVPPDVMVAESGELARTIDARTFALDVQTVPLDEVEQVWTAPAAAGTRVVVTPQR
ncbi:zinc-binding alcohol dehydrogenase family protein [Cellulomonas sp. P22]|uniref:zinc-binding alcohol dehydrogenase family protein n=1 Tax=Cellulomonas sp. P22 TaxID=3373189 RepID=UPI0037AFA46B